MLPVIVSLLLSASAWAQFTGAGDLLSPSGKTRAQYRASWYPREEAAGQARSLGLTQHEASVVTPVSLGEKDDWLVGGSLREYSHRGDAPVPDSLWDISAGPTWRHRLSEDRLVGGNLGVGSAGDKPFSRLGELVLHANAYYSWPGGGDRERWYVLVNWSNNRQFMNYLPVPGVAYSYESADKRTRTFLGLPFLSVMHQPVKDLTLSLLYLAPTIVNASATVRMLGPLQAYAGFAWTNQRFYLDQRRTDRERIFYDEKRATAGVRSPLSRTLLLELFGGYAFDRKYFSSEYYFHDRHEVLSVAASPVAGAQLSASW